MRFSSTICLAVLAFLVLAALPLAAQETLPRFVTVDPMNGKIGDTATVNGENIGKAVVAELYLTDGKNDLKCVILDQTDTAIKFTIPKGAKSGISYKLMVLTKGKEPKLIEQPVRYTIDET